MAHRPTSKLNPKKRYLQMALNSTLEEAHKIIRHLPISDRIIVEAGTPFIKRYGEHGIRRIRNWYEERLSGQILTPVATATVSANSVRSLLFQSARVGATTLQKTSHATQKNEIFPYVVADLKTMDRGDTEVELAARGGASAAIALGGAPIETLNSFIAACEAHRLDAMIDMMNVEFPLSVLRALKKIPPVVILHRGVDEERDNKEKQIPLHEIRRIKGNYHIMISIAGGDTLREVQRSIFNDADIVVIWKSVYQETQETIELVNGFLMGIK
ncbi:MAG: bifunctional enzyme Fae/Hp [Parcubacteria group bacterium Gr01-1014_66]|nr:MAG: bifunctional enzyme Fae/Hp [Parcubacteria group bacterium Gr01-1014_66]